MLERTLRTLSSVLSLFVVVGFGLFAIDSTRSASQQSKAQIEGRLVAAGELERRGTEPSKDEGPPPVRAFIDDVNDVLLAPFAPLTQDSTTDWVQRGIPALLALLVYGFVLSTLARFSRGCA